MYIACGHEKWTSRSGGDGVVIDGGDDKIPFLCTIRAIQSRQ